MKFSRLGKISVLVSLITYVIFLFIARFSGISIDFIINIQNYFIKSAITGSAGQGTISSLAYVLSPFAAVFISIVFLAISFASMASYGYYDDNKSAGILAGIVGAALTLVAFPTLTGIFIAISICIAFIYMVPLSNTYGKELKKWPRFRVGSNAVRKAFLIFNVIVAVGIFFVVLSNISVYQSNFRGDITNTMTEITLQSLPPEAAALGTDTIKQRIASSIDNSSVLNGYIKWLPVTSAFEFLIIMEFLTGLIFSNIAGLASSALIKSYSHASKRS